MNPSSRSPWLGPTALTLMTCGAVVPLGQAARAASAAPMGRPAGGGAATASVASHRPVLVELFTSQGCSSCPAADELVRDLPRLGLGPERVLPLTFHVDYWDDLGWKDPFASPTFTARQRRYAASGALAAPAREQGLSGLYTPQMIVDGRVHLSGGRRELAMAEIARAAARTPEADLTAEAEAGASDLVVTAHIVRRDPRKRARWELLVAVAAREQRTRVARGENVGRTLTEAAVVRVLSSPVSLDSRPEADRERPVQVRLSKPKDLAWSEVEVVVFVQSPDTLQVIATALVPVISHN